MLAAYPHHNSFTPQLSDFAASLVRPIIIDIVFSKISENFGASQCTRWSRIIATAYAQGAVFRSAALQPECFASLRKSSFEEKFKLFVSGEVQIQGPKSPKYSKISETNSVDINRPFRNGKTPTSDWFADLCQHCSTSDPLMLL